MFPGKGTGIILATALLSGAPPAQVGKPAHEEIVNAAVAAAPSIPEQAEALARLAWPPEPGDPEVEAFARDMLVHYGRHGIKAIRGAITRATPDLQADVVKAFVEAYQQVHADIPAGYVEGLEDAIWFGTREARKVAIPEITRLGFTPALLPIIDAAVEDPELLPVAIPALGALRNDKARHFLGKVMVEEKGETRNSAALVLAQIGNRAHQVLRTAMRSDDKELRLMAVRALLPYADTEDLAALHTYAYDHGDDDPDTTRAVRATALILEESLAAQQAADAASSPPE